MKRHRERIECEQARASASEEYRDSEEAAMTKDIMQEGRNLCRGRSQTFLTISCGGQGVEDTAFQRYVGLNWSEPLQPNVLIWTGHPYLHEYTSTKTGVSLNVTRFTNMDI